MDTQQQLPMLPGLGLPIPPTDPERAKLYKHPRPGMQVAEAAPEGYEYVLAPKSPNKPQPTQAPPNPYVAEDGGPPVRGLNTYNDIGPGIIVEGVRYGFRRLGIEDCNTIYQIGEEIISWGVHQGVAKFGSFLNLLREQKESMMVNSGGESWLLAIIAPFLGVRMVKAELFALIESILLVVPEGEKRGYPIEKGSLTNPDMFPMGCLPQLLTAIGNHPDIASFFGSCMEVGKIPIVQTVMHHLLGKTNQVLDNMMAPPTSTAGSE